MADKKGKILVDKDLRPVYYDDFHCLAQDCRFSCCKGWKVAFSKKDYLSLKRESGSPELKEKLEGGLQRVRDSVSDLTYGEFNMDSGVCPLLREDGLCGLQIEKGHSALPRVCRVYPRMESYMPSGYLERSLSPSCEAVLKLLWDLPEGIGFRSDPLPKADYRTVSSTVEGPTVYWFSVVREWCIDRLQDRRFPLPERIFLMGLGLKELAEDGADIDHWMKRAALLPERTDVSSLLPEGDRELVLYLSNCLYVLLSIQSPDSVLRSVPWELAGTLHLKASSDTLTFSAIVYQEARARFEEHFRDRDYFMENLMTTVFFHLRLPQTGSAEEMWKSYLNFCNLYAMYRFLAVMSCREGVEDPRAELFRLMVFASRSLIHNSKRQTILQDELFKNDSATLAHMAILLCG